MTEELYQQFLNFLKDKNYEYTTETEILLKELKQSAIEENNFQTIENLYQEMEEKIKLDKSRDLIKYKDEISKFLTSEIITRYYYQKGRIIYTLKNDVDIKTAKEILLDKTKYNSILSK